MIACCLVSFAAAEYRLGYFFRNKNFCVNRVVVVGTEHSGLRLSVRQRTRRLAPNSMIGNDPLSTWKQPFSDMKHRLQVNEGEIAKFTHNFKPRRSHTGDPGILLLIRNLKTAGKFETSVRKFERLQHLGANYGYSQTRQRAY